MHLLKQISKSQVLWKNDILSCSVGYNGFAKDKREGDGCTPVGKWKLLTVYYRPDKIDLPKTSLPVVAITSDMGWSDDPIDHLYNCQVTKPHDFSHENLWRDDNLYDLLITTSHNVNPSIPGLGSAIFIHQMHENQTPTAGCLGLKLPDLEYLVSTATPDTYWEVCNTLTP